MKANKKKIIVLVAMVLLLVATGCLNYFLNVNKTKAPVDADGDGLSYTFFVDCRLDREAVRAQQISALDEVIATNSSVDAVANAEELKLTIIRDMQTEVNIEHLIKAKGFEDVVVTIGEQSVNVIVKDAELDKEKTAQIIFVVVSETDFAATDVNVMPFEL